MKHIHMGAFHIAWSSAWRPRYFHRVKVGRFRSWDFGRLRIMYAPD